MGASQSQDPQYGRSRARKTGPSCIDADNPAGELPNVAIRFMITCIDRDMPPAARPKQIQIARRRI